MRENASFLQYACNRTVYLGTLAISSDNQLIVHFIVVCRGGFRRVARPHSPPPERFRGWRRHPPTISRGLDAPPEPRPLWETKLHIKDKRRTRKSFEKVYFRCRLHWFTYMILNP